MTISAAAVVRTTAFRVAAVYALLYAALTGAAVVAVYSIAEHEIHRQVRAGILDETSALVSLLEARGPGVLGEIIAKRSAHERASGAVDPDNPDDRYYLLADAGGRVLVGDLGRWPRGTPASGWYRFQADGGGPALGLVTPLGKGMTLMVAQSLATPDALSGMIRRWVIIASALALLMGLLAGMAVGRRVMGRIRGEVLAAERVRAGRLSERLPTTGSSEQSLLARAFNQMLDRIEIAIVGLRDLAARTAHEMQHPLTRADQALARAQTRNDLPAMRRELGTARAELAELSHRVNALLRLARIESGAPREYFAGLDLARLGRDVTGLYAPLAEERGGSLDFEGPQAAPYTGDHQLLAQALANLLDNALKHSPGAPIRVHLYSGDGWHTFEVCSRSDGAARPAAPGTGLGLPIARAIARLHDGDLSVARDPGAFTARLRLPLRPPSGTGADRDRPAPGSGGG